MTLKHKVLLIIRDGWGHGKPDKGNAIYNAHVPNHTYYTQNFPTSVIQCTGNAVGNPEGSQGGSEVGHLTIGAGRIVWQPYELINQKIKHGEFFTNEVLLSAIIHCKNNGTNLHLDGLFSTEGVHADYRHLLALLKLCKQEEFDRVFVHLTLDGRDMPERSALPLVEETEKKIAELGVGKIASVIGRYYAMDRDQNWDRTQKAYDLLVKGEGFKAMSARQAIEAAYQRGEKTDYYVQPTVILTEQNHPVAMLQENDALIWYNFRSDRSRQITAMINQLDFCPVKIPDTPHVYYVCFSSYDSNWNLPVAFPQEQVVNNVGSVLAQNQVKQLRIAETEKYAHVTFFFNSQVENPFPGEECILVASPKVSSYDQKPEMSAYEVTERLLAEMSKYEFILVNYANPDLVGHSGVFQAVVKACEVVDECCGKVIKEALDNDFVVFLMADHGNADHMLYDNGDVDPSHGYNPVLLTVISNDLQLQQIHLAGGGHQDIAPTILEVMGIDKPQEMTGISLIVSSLDKL